MGKRVSPIYARLSLLQLIPEVAEAFTQERITASHANLIARFPQESQDEAYEQCWRKNWQEKEAPPAPREEPVPIPERQPVRVKSCSRPSPWA